MKTELKLKIAEENKFYNLLQNNPNYRLQGYSMELKKVIVGIIKGSPKSYSQGVDQLNFKYFDSWKYAYMQLVG